MKKKIYFVVGSQDLYGEETLKQKNSAEMARFMSSKINSAKIEYYGTVKGSDSICKAIQEVNYNDDCIGIIVWCHTFFTCKDVDKTTKSTAKTNAAFTHSI